MPLTRDTVTAASRIMLPAYPVFTGLVGLNYVIAGDDLLMAGVVYRVADRIIPLPAWGAVFLLVAAGMAIAMAVHRRLGYQLALAALGGLMAVWAAVGLGSAIWDQGSWTAGLWPGFVLVCCVATWRSLDTREV